MRSTTRPVAADLAGLPVRSFVAWVPLGERARQQRSAPPSGWLDWQAGPLTVRYAPRAGAATPAASGAGLRLVLGDPSELVLDGAARNVAAGVPIACDAAEGSIVLHTSIVGLPPVFTYLDADLVAICSDLHLLVGLAGNVLRLNPLGVSELGSVAHPIEHRTLFADTAMAPSGGRLALDRTGKVAFQRTWSLPPRSPRSWSEFIEAQLGAFTESVTAIDTSTSFLSLTAGLDTRTVFASLASQDRLVPAVTMTGPKQSLDARAAERLCAAYGVRHTLVAFDDAFVRRLPTLMETASRLSGGLASLDQAPEVYLYEQLGGEFGARLSGNLGNQVGRGGTEGVSTRDASLAILGGLLRGASHGASPGGHWLLGHLGQDEHATLEYILGQEIAFTLASNFPIGNHFATQQTPYASRALIETLALRPTSRTSAPPKSTMLRSSRCCSPSLAPPSSTGPSNARALALAAAGVSAADGATLRRPPMERAAQRVNGHNNRATGSNEGSKSSSARSGSRCTRSSGSSSSKTMTKAPIVRMTATSRCAADTPYALATSTVADTVASASSRRTGTKSRSGLSRYRASVSGRPLRSASSLRDSRIRALKDASIAPKYTPAMASRKMSSGVMA